MTWKEDNERDKNDEDTSDVVFCSSRTITQRQSEGRISRAASTRLQLLKIKHEEYHSSTSRNIALAILRDIKDTPKRKKDKPEFVNEIRRKLLILHDYNCNTTQVKGKFPYSKQLILLLLRYVQLEHDTLYSPKNYNIEYEKEVERRVLCLLEVMLIDAVTKFGYKNTLHATSKCVLRVLNKVSPEYRTEDKFVGFLITKLLKKLGLLDEITKIKESRGALSMKNLLHNPTVQLLSTASIDDLSDCDSEESIEVSDYFGYSAYKDESASSPPTKGQIQRLKSEEPGKDASMNQVLTIEVVHGDIQDEDLYMMYIFPEVKTKTKCKSSREFLLNDEKCSFLDFLDEDKPDVTDYFINSRVQLDRNTSDNNAIKSTNYNHLNISNCNKHITHASQNGRNVSNNNIVVIDDDDDDNDIEIVDDKSSVKLNTSIETKTQSALISTIKSTTLNVIDVVSDDDETSVAPDLNNGFVINIDDEDDILDKFNNLSAPSLETAEKTNEGDNQVNEISSSEIFDTETDDSSIHLSETENIHLNIPFNIRTENYRVNQIERFVTPISPGVDVPYSNIEISSTTGRSYERQVIEETYSRKPSRLQKANYTLHSSELGECSNSYRFIHSEKNPNLLQSDESCRESKHQNSKKDVRPKRKTPFVGLDTHQDLLENDSKSIDQSQNSEYNIFSTNVPHQRRLNKLTNSMNSTTIGTFSDNYSKLQSLNDIQGNKEQDVKSFNLKKHGEIVKFPRKQNLLTKPTCSKFATSQCATECNESQILNKAFKNKEINNSLDEIKSYEYENKTISKDNLLKSYQQLDVENTTECNAIKAPVYGSKYNSDGNVQLKHGEDNIASISCVSTLDIEASYKSCDTEAKLPEIDKLNEEDNLIFVESVTGIVSETFRECEIQGNDVENYIANNKLQVQFMTTSLQEDEQRKKCDENVETRDIELTTQNRQSDCTDLNVLHEQHNKILAENVNVRKNEITLNYNRSNDDNGLWNMEKSDKVALLKHIENNKFEMDYINYAHDVIEPVPLHEIEEKYAESDKLQCNSTLVLGDSDTHVENEYCDVEVNLKQNENLKIKIKHKLQPESDVENAAININDVCNEYERDYDNNTSTDPSELCNENNVYDSLSVGCIEEIVISDKNYENNGNHDCNDIEENVILDTHCKHKHAANGGNNRSCNLLEFHDNSIVSSPERIAINNHDLIEEKSVTENLQMDFFENKRCDEELGNNIRSALQFKIYNVSDKLCRTTTCSVKKNDTNEDSIDQRLSSETLSQVIHFEENDKTPCNNISYRMRDSEASSEFIHVDEIDKVTVTIIDALGNETAPAAQIDRVSSSLIQKNDAIQNKIIGGDVKTNNFIDEELRDIISISQVGKFMRNNANLPNDILSFVPTVGAIINEINKEETNKIMMLNECELVSEKGIIKNNEIEIDVVPNEKFIENIENLHCNVSSCTSANETVVEENIEISSRLKSGSESKAELSSGIFEANLCRDTILQKFSVNDDCSVPNSIIENTEETKTTSIDQTSEITPVSQVERFKLTNQDRNIPFCVSIQECSADGIDVDNGETNKVNISHKEGETTLHSQMFKDDVNSCKIDDSDHHIFTEDKGTQKLTENSKIFTNNIPLCVSATESSVERNENVIDVESNKIVDDQELGCGTTSVLRIEIFKGDENLCSNEISSSNLNKIEPKISEDKEETKVNSSTSKMTSILQPEKHLCGSISVPESGTKIVAETNKIITVGDLDNKRTSLPKIEILEGNNNNNKSLPTSSGNCVTTPANFQKHEKTENKSSISKIIDFTEAATIIENKESSNCTKIQNKLSEGMDEIKCVVNQELDGEENNQVLFKLTKDCNKLIDDEKDILVTVIQDKENTEDLEAFNNNSCNVQGSIKLPISVSQVEMCKHYEQICSDISLLSSTSIEDRSKIVFDHKFQNTISTISQEILNDKNDDNKPFIDQEIENDITIIAQDAISEENIKKYLSKTSTNEDRLMNDVIKNNADIKTDNKNVTGKETTNCTSNTDSCCMSAIESSSINYSIEGDGQSKFVIDHKLENNILSVPEKSFTDSTQTASRFSPSALESSTYADSILDNSSQEEKLSNINIDPQYENDRERNDLVDAKYPNEIKSHSHCSVATRFIAEDEELANSSRIYQNDLVKTDDHKITINTIENIEEISEVCFTAGGRSAMSKIPDMHCSNPDDNHIARSDGLALEASENILVYINSPHETEIALAEITIGSEIDVQSHCDYQVPLDQSVFIKNADTSIPEIINKLNSETTSSKVLEDFSSQQTLNLNDANEDVPISAYSSNILDTTSLNVLAKVAAEQKILEVRSQSLQENTTKTESKQNRSRLKIPSKHFAARKIRSPKTKQTEIRKTLPRAAKLNVQIDYSNNGTEKRNTRSSVTKPNDFTKLNKNKLKCKPNEFKDNVCHQPPNHIYAAEHISDLSNALSEDSCDSFKDNLVIAEDAKHEQFTNGNLQCNSIESNRLEISIYDESTTEDGLVLINSSILNTNDEINPILISIPDTDDQGIYYQILQEIEEINACDTDKDNENQSYKSVSSFEFKNKLDDGDNLNNSEIKDVCDLPKLEIECQPIKPDSSGITTTLENIYENVLKNDSDHKDAPLNIPEVALDYRDCLNNIEIENDSHITTPTDHSIENILNISPKKLPTNISHSEILKSNDDFKRNKDIVIKRNSTDYFESNGTATINTSSTLQGDGNSLVDMCRENIDISSKDGPFEEQLIFSHDGEILEPNINEISCGTLEVIVRNCELSKKTKSKLQDYVITSKELILCENKKEATQLPVRTKAALKSYDKSKFNPYVRISRIVDLEDFRLKYKKSLINLDKMTKTNDVSIVGSRTLRSKSCDGILRTLQKDRRHSLHINMQYDIDSPMCVKLDVKEIEEKMKDDTKINDQEINVCEIKSKLVKKNIEDIVTKIKKDKVNKKFNTSDQENNLKNIKKIVSKQDGTSYQSKKPRKRLPSPRKAKRDNVRKQNKKEVETIVSNVDLGKSRISKIGLMENADAYTVQIPTVERSIIKKCEDGGKGSNTIKQNIKRDNSNEQTKGRGKEIVSVGDPQYKLRLNQIVPIENAYDGKIVLTVQDDATIQKFKRPENKVHKRKTKRDNVNEQKTSEKDVYKVDLQNKVLPIKMDLTQEICDDNKLQQSALVEKLDDILKINKEKENRKTRSLKTKKSNRIVKQREDEINLSKEIENKMKQKTKRQLKDDKMANELIASTVDHQEKNRSQMDETENFHENLTKDVQINLNIETECKTLKEKTEMIVCKDKIKSNETGEIKKISDYKDFQINSNKRSESKTLKQTTTKYVSDQNRKRNELMACDVDLQDKSQSNQVDLTEKTRNDAYDGYRAMVEESELVTKYESPKPNPKGTKAPKQIAKINVSEQNRKQKEVIACKVSLNDQFLFSKMDFTQKTSDDESVEKIEVRKESEEGFQVNVMTLREENTREDISGQNIKGPEIIVSNVGVEATNQSSQTKLTKQSCDDAYKFDTQIEMDNNAIVTNYEDAQINFCKDTENKAQNSTEFETVDGNVEEDKDQSCQTHILKNICKVTNKWQGTEDVQTNHEIEYKTQQQSPKQDVQTKNEKEIIVSNLVVQSEIQRTDINSTKNPCKDALGLHTSTIEESVAGTKCHDAQNLFKKGSKTLKQKTKTCGNGQNKKGKEPQKEVQSGSQVEETIRKCKNVQIYLNQDIESKARRQRPKKDANEHSKIQKEINIHNEELQEERKLQKRKLKKDNWIEQNRKGKEFCHTDHHDEIQSRKMVVDVQETIANKCEDVQIIVNEPAKCKEGKENIEKHHLSEPNWTRKDACDTDSQVKTKNICNLQDTIQSSNLTEINDDAKACKLKVQQLSSLNKHENMQFNLEEKTGRKTRKLSTKRDDSKEKEIIQIEVEASKLDLNISTKVVLVVHDSAIDKCEDPKMNLLEGIGSKTLEKTTKYLSKPNKNEKDEIDCDFKSQNIMKSSVTDLTEPAPLQEVVKKCHDQINTEDETRNYKTKELHRDVDLHEKVESSKVRLMETVCDAYEVPLLHENESDQSKDFGISETSVNSMETCYETKNNRFNENQGLDIVKGNIAVHNTSRTSKCETNIETISVKQNTSSDKSDISAVIKNENNENLSEKSKSSKQSVPMGEISVSNEYEEMLVKIAVLEHTNIDYLQNIIEPEKIIDSTDPSLENTNDIIDILHVENGTKIVGIKSTVEEMKDDVVEIANINTIPSNRQIYGTGNLTKEANENKNQNMSSTEATVSKSIIEPNISMSKSEETTREVHFPIGVESLKLDLVKNDFIPHATDVKAKAEKEHLNDQNVPHENVKLGTNISSICTEKIGKHENIPTDYVPSIENISNVIITVEVPEMKKLEGNRPSHFNEGLSDSKFIGLKRQSTKLDESAKKCRLEMPVIKIENLKLSVKNKLEKAQLELKAKEKLINKSKGLKKETKTRGLKNRIVAQDRQKEAVRDNKKVLQESVSFEYHKESNAKQSYDNYLDSNEIVQPNSCEKTPNKINANETMQSEQIDNEQDLQITANEEKQDDKSVMNVKQISSFKKKTSSKIQSVRILKLDDGKYDKSLDLSNEFDLHISPVEEKLGEQSVPVCETKIEISEDRTSKIQSEAMSLKLNDEKIDTASQIDLQKFPIEKKQDEKIIIVCEENVKLLEDSVVQIHPETMSLKLNDVEYNEKIDTGSELDLQKSPVEEKDDGKSAPVCDANMKHKEDSALQIQSETMSLRLNDERYNGKIDLGHELDLRKSLVEEKDDEKSAPVCEVNTNLQEDFVLQIQAETISLKLNDERCIEKMNLGNEIDIRKSPVEEKGADKSVPACDANMKLKEHFVLQIQSETMSLKLNDERYIEKMDLGNELELRKSPVEEKGDEKSVPVCEANRKFKKDSVLQIQSETMSLKLNDERYNKNMDLHNELDLQKSPIEEEKDEKSVSVYETKIQPVTMFQIDEKHNALEEEDAFKKQSHSEINKTKNTGLHTEIVTGKIDDSSAVEIISKDLHCIQNICDESGYLQNENMEADNATNNLMVESVNLNTACDLLKQDVEIENLNRTEYIGKDDLTIELDTENVIDSLNDFHESSIVSKKSKKEEVNFVDVSNISLPIREFQHELPASIPVDDVHSTNITKSLTVLEPEISLEHVSGSENLQTANVLIFDKRGVTEISPSGIPNLCSLKPIAENLDLMVANTSETTVPATYVNENDVISMEINDRNRIISTAQVSEQYEILSSNVTEQLDNVDNTMLINDNRISNDYKDAHLAINPNKLITSTPTKSIVTSQTDKMENICIENNSPSPMSLVPPDIISTSIPLSDTSSTSLNIITSEMSNFDSSQILTSSVSLCNTRLTTSVSFVNDLQVSNVEDNPASNKNFDTIDVDETPLTILKVLGTIQIGSGTSDHDYSLGGPLLSGKCENNDLNQSNNSLSDLKNEKEPNEGLDNSPVDTENMFPFSEQVCITSLMGNNLTQESSRNLNDSPVDSGNDYQLCEQDHQLNFSFIENQEVTQSLDDNTNIQENMQDSIVDLNIEINLKQEQENEGNITSLINDFKSQGCYEYSQPTLMSVEKMNKLLHSNSQADDINIAIASLNNLLSTTNQKNEEDKDDSVYQFDDTNNSDECTVSSANDFAVSSLVKLGVQSNSFPLANFALNDIEQISFTDIDNPAGLPQIGVDVQVKATSPESLHTISDVIKQDTSLTTPKKVKVKYNKYEFASTDNIFSESDFNCAQTSANGSNINLTKSNKIHAVTLKDNTKDSSTKTNQMEYLKSSNKQTSLQRRISSDLRTKILADIKVKSPEKINNCDESAFAVRRNNKTPVSAPPKKKIVSPPQIEKKADLLEKQTGNVSKECTQLGKSLPATVIIKPNVNSSKLVNILENKMSEKIVPKANIEDITKDKLNKLLDSLPIGKASYENFKQKPVTKIVLNTNVNPKDLKKSMENLTELKASDVQSPKSIRETLKAASTFLKKQELRTSELMMNDTFKDKYDDIKSRQRKTTNKLIDNYSHEKLLRVEEDAKSKTKSDKAKPKLSFTMKKSISVSKIDKKEKRKTYMDEEVLTDLLLCKKTKVKPKSLVDYDESSLSDDVTKVKQRKYNSDEDDRANKIKRDMSTSDDDEIVSKKRKMKHEDRLNSEETDALFDRLRQEGNINKLQETMLNAHNVEARRRVSVRGVPDKKYSTELRKSDSHPKGIAETANRNNEPTGSKVSKLCVSASQTKTAQSTSSYSNSHPHHPVRETERYYNQYVDRSRHTLAEYRDKRREHISAGNYSRYPPQPDQKYVSRGRSPSSRHGGSSNRRPCFSEPRQSECGQYSSTHGSRLQPRRDISVPSYLSYLSNIRIGNPRKPTTSTTNDHSWIDNISKFLPPPNVSFQSPDNRENDGKHT